METYYGREKSRSYNSIVSNDDIIDLHTDGSENQGCCHRRLCTGRTGCIFKFIVLPLSIMGNIGLGGMLYLLITAHTTFPVAPPYEPVYNGTCPYNSTVGNISEPEFTMYATTPNEVSICWPVYPHAVRDNAPYMLEADDWMSNRTTFVPIWAGDDNQYTIKNLAPGIPVQVRLTVFQHLSRFENVTFTSEVSTLKTQDSNYCGNLADLTRLKSMPDIGNRLKGCAVNSNPIPCIAKATGLSTPCSGCFASENQCVLQQCIEKNGAPCLLKPNAMPCQQCVSDRCMPQTAECAGLPGWALNISSGIFTPS